MQVDRVETIDGFERLRSDWESAFVGDCRATVFSAWGWLRGWMEGTANEWVILAARPEGNGPYVAFLPLQLTPITRGWRTKLTPAGHPFASRTSLVCLPQRTDEAVPALARAVASLMEETGIRTLTLREMADPRWKTLLGSLPSRYRRARESTTACPYLPLPDTWEEYIGNSRKRRSLLRRAEARGFRNTRPGPEDLEDAIDVFLSLHQLRMGPQSPAYLRVMRSLLRWTYRTDLLHLAILRLEEEPAAAMVGFTDSRSGTFHAFNGGWDPRFRKQSPRRVLELQTIRHMIERGYAVYDLGRGNDPYKYGYGAVERRNTNAVLWRATRYRIVNRAVERTALARRAFGV